MLAQFYHVAVCAYYLFVSHWLIENLVNKEVDLTISDPAIATLKRYSKRYLTNWTFTIQTVYFVFCVLEDVFRLISSNERLKNSIRKFRTYLFAALAGPSAILVSTVFWGLWAIDRNLIFPKVLELVLPPWVNHSIHTFTSVAILGELIVSNHKYPSVRQAIPGVTIYFLLYCICLLSTYFESGIWLYPILKFLTWPTRFAFFIGCYVFTIIVFVLLRFSSHVIWRNKDVPETTKKQKKKTR